jgi:NAD(P) transhydrogenase
VRVDLDSGKDVVGDALFYAVGRQAQSDTLSLDAAGVSLAKRGLIPVNEFFQTSVPHIYACGDIIGFPALASTSMEQGRLCSQHMFGAACAMKPVFPYGIYTIPEISVVSSFFLAHEHVTEATSIELLARLA